MKDEIILKVSNLSAGYGEQSAVENLSFQLRLGEILCLAGESGSGKSTVLKALLSMPEIHVSSGEIHLFGTDLQTLSEKKRRSYCTEKMGMVFQSPGASFNPIRSYQKQFVETLKSHGKYDAAAFLSQAEAAFAKVDLKDARRLLRACPYALSGGMNQRMALALVMLLGQEILLCDEPTSALDATTALQVARELKKLRDENGISQILVTHNLAMAGFLADRIGIMYQGSLVELGETDHILHQPKHPYTKSLLEAIPHLSGELPSGEPMDMLGGAHDKTEKAHAEKGGRS